VAVQKGKEQAATKKVRAKVVSKSEETRNPRKDGGAVIANEKEVAEPSEENTEAAASSRSRLVALLLCFFLGWAGGHRFYAGKTGTGLMMMFTMGGFGIWYFLDFIQVASGAFKDKSGLPITSWS
jgi:hypothetical protein